MPIEPIIEQINVKRVPAVDCWRLVYDTQNNIMIFDRGTESLVTANQVFCGTKEECDDHIAKQNLRWPDSEEVPESASILSSSEKDKEDLKEAAITYIRQNPESSLDDFRSSYTWEKQALILVLLASYARQAYVKRLIDIEAPDERTCWNLLKGIVLSSTDKELQKMLR